MGERQPVQCKVSGYVVTLYIAAKHEQPSAFRIHQMVGRIKNLVRRGSNETLNPQHETKQMEGTICLFLMATIHTQHTDSARLPKSIKLSSSAFPLIPHIASSHAMLAYSDRSAQGGRLWCGRRMPIMFQSEKVTSSTTIRKHGRRYLRLTLSKMHGVRPAFGH